MAVAVEKNWPSPLEGIAVTRYQHGLPTQRIRIVEAGHPVPDAAGEQAAGEILAQVRALGSEDFLLALISGGGVQPCRVPATLIPSTHRSQAREFLRP